MNKKLRKLIGISILACLLLIPLPARADQNIQIPPKVSQVVPEADLIQLIYYTSLWKSADLYAHLEAADEVLTPLIVEIRQVAGSQVTLPDVSGMRKDYQARLAAIGQSSTVAKAQQKVRELVQSVSSVQASFMNMRQQLGPAIAVLEQKGAMLETTFKPKIDAEAAQEEARIEEELDQKAKSKAAQIRARLEQEATSCAQSLTAAAGKDADPETLRRQVQAFVDRRSEQYKSQLMRELEQEAAKAEEQAQQRLEERAKQLMGAEGEKLKRIRDSFQHIDQDIEKLAQQKLASFASHREEALQKKTEIVRKVVDSEVSQAEDLIRSKSSLAARAREQGREVPSIEGLIAQLRADKQELVSKLVQAESDEKLQEAQASFTAKWEATRKDMELLAVQGAQEIVQKTQAKLNDTQVESKLRSALGKTTSGIENLERTRRDKGKLDAEAERRLKQLRMLLPQIREGLALIGEFNKAKPTDDIEALLSLKDRLQSKLEAIQRVTKEESMLAGAGVFIEAENESATRLLPRDVYWHSAKEINATWRPGPSGGADWYLSRGGEALVYTFVVDEDGAYILWVRDLSSNSHPSGARSVKVVIDGSALGVFAEHTLRVPEPGAFAWHKTAKVDLKVGTHRMEIIKTETTSAAAILDAFYLTKDPNDIP